jgi:hypothetical protein
VNYHDGNRTGSSLWNLEQADTRSARKADHENRLGKSARKLG